eukprot:SAG25_NODE_3800_length_965_cov_1.458430_1_plen_115_part_00
MVVSAPSTHLGADARVYERLAMKSCGVASLAGSAATESATVVLPRRTVGDAVAAAAAASSANASRPSPSNRFLGFVVVTGNGTASEFAVPTASVPARSMGDTQPRGVHSSVSAA